MAGKVKHLKIFGYDFTFVFRHKFEKENEDNLLDSLLWWNEYRLGFWYKKTRNIGRKNFKHPDKWNENLVNDYMFGINLLICKAWFTVSKGAMHLDMKK